jgi:hypothetical protein
MSPQLSRIAALAGLSIGLLAAGCDHSATIPHTPNHLSIVSGTGQAGNVSTTLAAPLVVEALDGANKPVSGVVLTWTITGGGTLSATTDTTNANGQASVTWTLAPSVGTQVATVTSAAISGSSVSFVANNGASISGTVTSTGTTPYVVFSRSPAHPVLASASVQPAVTRHPLVDRIVVGFKSGALGVAAPVSGAYRSMAVARTTASALQTRLSAAMQSRPLLSHAELSPVLLAARVRVDDPTQVDSMLASLRADPSVAWAERDAIVSIRDGAPHPVSAKYLTSLAASRASVGGSSNPSAGPSSVATKLPNDPDFFEQYWSHNMVDLPKAWGITTGSTNVVVAVVDMGVRFDDAEVAGNYTHDGYDFVSQVGYGTPQALCAGGTFNTIDGDGDGPDPDPTDPNDLEFDSTDNCWFENSLGDHGLWTSGIIGAVGNDGSAGAGVNWTVKLRPVRVLGITGDGTDFDIAQGILYAAGLPAPGANGILVQAPTVSQIINMSLGGPDSSDVLANAVAAAEGQGSLIVASAGNDGWIFPTYPAAYPGVVGVSAVGEDGNITPYSDAGSFVSLAAPGGDFRLDTLGGGGILGPGWDFTVNEPTDLFGYGTSASAPFVSGIAALMLAQTPGLTAATLVQRLEQYATRPAGAGRNDQLGWGIVNAYNSLTQQNGAPRKTYVRLLDATTGNVLETVAANADGSFAFAQLAAGAYYVQAGEDEAGDGQIGIPGRRFTWAGGFGAPTIFNVNGQSQNAGIALAYPFEVEPNDVFAQANQLSVGGYVIGQLNAPDVRDTYAVAIPSAGTYTFETTGFVGSCGLGLDVYASLTLQSAAGAVVGTSRDYQSATSLFCARLTTALTPGVYYVTISPVANEADLVTNGRYRLQVRSGS